MKLAVVGATGLVGQAILQVLAERNFKYDELLLVASKRSVGKAISYQGKDYKVISIINAIQKQPDIAIFSAGGETSRLYAPQFAEVGTIIIDNSSAWRMHRKHKLIVPEVNLDVLTPEDKIIANPNCSTIQLVVALAPLHKVFKIRRLVISTYQSVTGTGKAAVDQLMAERAGQSVTNPIYPHPIDLNALPQIDIFLENNYTKEEMKMVNETHKILDDNSIAITATAVRIPTIGGHAEAVNIEFEKPYTIKQVRTLLREAKGVVIQDDTSQNIYPMPITVHKKDTVFVGRIRRDNSLPNALNIWIVADNLRKGAATNAVQIAEQVRFL